MPRTKKIDKKHNSESKQFRELKKNLEGDRDNAIEEMDKMFDDLILNVKMKAKMELLSIPNKSKMLGELKAESEAATAPKEPHPNVNKTVVVNNSNKTLKRSYSFNDDGYLTTESCSIEIPETSKRNSRNRNRTVKKARLSRSHSKSSNNTKMLTPLTSNTSHSTTNFTVTPKINPKTPHAILRRPKIGETAISLQGSPLMVGNVVSDTLANINIPLDDGNLMSIQPRSGLRKSQVPLLNPEVQNQLKTLRANLNLLLD